MSRFLPSIVLVVLAIYCWIELAQSDPREVRQVRRAFWALLIAVPFFGPVGWLVYGRPNGEPPAAVTPPPRPRMSAPDDDPEFLRSLKADPPPDA